MDLSSHQDQFSHSTDIIGAIVADNNKKWKASTEQSDNIEFFNRYQMEASGRGSDNITLQNQNMQNCDFLPAAQSAFSIDHILELIFIDCADRQTLFNCRLVSSRWAYFVTKALQKTVNMTFGIFRSDNRCIPQMLRTVIGRTIEDSIDVMNKSTDFEFPVTSFKFSAVDHSSSGDRRINQFLVSHGHSVRKLKLEGVFNLYELKRLLLVQAPNLQILSINRLNILKWNYEQRVGPEPEDEENDEKYYSEEKIPQEQLPIFYQTQNEELLTILKNLKVFKCNTNYAECIPQVCIQEILKISPNLVQVEFPYYYLHNLIQPVNRLKLLKELFVFWLFGEFPDSLRAIIVDHHNTGHLALTKIHFHGPGPGPGPGRQRLEENKMFLRSADCLTNILKSSAESCKSLLWMGCVTYFEIPQMPGVVDLVNECWMVNGKPFHMLEKWSNLRDTFPNLKSLSITLHDCEGISISVSRFFGANDVEVVAMPSVRKVSLHSFQAHPILLDRFKEMFSNAEIDNVISKPHSGLFVCRF